MALGLAAAVGPGFWIVAFVIGFIARPRFTRHVRATATLARW
jgi:ABC-type dipeptide/oligopeptide/nickel transport system permease subunit